MAVNDELASLKRGLEAAMAISEARRKARGYFLPFRGGPSGQGFRADDGEWITEAAGWPSMCRNCAGQDQPVCGGVSRKAIVPGAGGNCGKTREAAARSAE